MSNGYRILSLDGGPGPLTVLGCLIEIEQSQPGFIQATDMFVGSSAGSFVALYLAIHMAEVDARTSTGLAVLQNCQAFFLDAMTSSMPIGVPAALEAFCQFIRGKPMLDYTSLQTVFDQPSNYGTATLGSLSRRAVIQAARMNAPWVPQVWDSRAPADAGVLCTSAALSSGAFPLAFAIQGTAVDGGMSTNSPTMIGLSRAIAGGPGAAPIPREEIRLLALGTDSGSSALANLFWPPGTAAPIVPSLRTRVEPLYKQLDDDLAELRKKTLTFRQDVQKAQDDDQGRHPKVLWEVATHTCRELERHATLSRGILRLPPVSPAGPTTAKTTKRAPRRARPRAAAVTPPPQPLDWGWPEWLAIPWSPLYMVQVLLTGEALGVSQQASWLLDDRALRLAPTALMGSNEALVLMMIGATDLAIKAAAHTTKLWADRINWFNFKPSFSDVKKWVAGTWMPSLSPPLTLQSSAAP